MNKTIEEILNSEPEADGIHLWSTMEKKHREKQIKELYKLLKEAEQRGFTKTWAIVEKLMSFNSPAEAEAYLKTLEDKK